MTGRVKTIPTANSWADEIDELNRERMLRILESISSARARRIVVNTEVAEDPLSGGKPGQNVPSASGGPQ